MFDLFQPYANVTDRRRPDENENIIFRFLDADQELDLKSGRKKGRPAREKTVRDGKLIWKDQALKLEMDEKPAVKREAAEMEDDDDLTASEGEFEALPAGPVATGFAIPSIKQEPVGAKDDGETEDDDTVDEDAILPPTLLKPASSSHKPSSGVDHVEDELDPPSSSMSPPPAPGPSEIVWGDLRGTMGQRRGKSGRTLLPGQSDDEDGNEAVSLPVIASGTAMRMKTFVASSKGKDRARKEDDQVVHVSNRCVREGRIELGHRSDILLSV